MIFVDEIDSFLSKRGQSSNEHEALRKMKNEFMTVGGCCAGALRAVRVVVGAWWGCCAAQDEERAHGSGCQLCMPGMPGMLWSRGLVWACCVLGFAPMHACVHRTPRSHPHSHSHSPLCPPTSPRPPQHWDGLRTKQHDRVLVLAATNRPMDLDEAVVRRMPRRIFVPLPDAPNRERILQVGAVRCSAVERVCEGWAAAAGLGGVKMVWEGRGCIYDYRNKLCQPPRCCLPMHHHRSILPARRSS